MAAEAIVSTVIQQLTSINGREVEQEVRLVVDVTKEIKMLTNNFRAIQAVLIDAEQRQVTDAAVQVLLDQLKDASYDLNDVLDEWNTEILKLQIEGVEKFQIPKQKVCCISPCFGFEQCALRPDIGVKIKKLSENIDIIAIKIGRYNHNTIRSVKEPQRLKTTSFIEVSDIHGRDNEKNILVNKLLNEKKETSLHIISIIGIGGIGKTTLAQLVYNDIKIRSNFEKRIWVSVSDSFDEVRIARAIIESIRGQAISSFEFQSLFKCLSETVVNKKFLLILDDVWIEDYEIWGSLFNSLNNGLCGSKILVTTREEKVSHVMNSIDVINIDKLAIDDSRLLFKQLAFCDKSQEEYKSLENIGKQIVDKCKGLPLAIKIVGSLLRFKKSIDQWQNILDSEIWKLEKLKGLFPPLLLSYNDLSSMVQRCFSYCAIFPKNYIIEKDELIKLWMAQSYFGLIQKEKLEIIGEEVFNILAMHSFFQDFIKYDDGSIYKCKMHDMVHDFAQFLVKNECFTKEINSREEENLTVSCENARHSMLLLNSSCQVNLRSVERLHSLLIECKDKSTGDFSPKLFEQLTCLRALKLSKSWDHNVASEIGKLIHLRYLNISGLAIKELPQTLCCLYNLQTLNLGFCHYLEKLPEGMGKLINLRHLMNYSTLSLKYMPKGIERLVCLRTLDNFVVGVDAHGKGMGTLKCLKHLNKLRGNLLLSGLENVVDEAEAMNARLMNKENLIDLELSFDYTSEMAAVEECNKDSAVLEALQPPPTLERLSIKRCRSMALSPQWMVSLTQLKLLSIRSCLKCEYLPPLGKLPLLQSLWIDRLKSVKRVSNEFVGMENMDTQSSSPSVVAFPKLETLFFAGMENWEDWEYQITGNIAIMPSLSSLQIQICPKLKSLPDHLLHSTSLKQLIIYECPILEEQYNLFVSNVRRRADAIENSP